MREKLKKMGYKILDELGMFMHFLIGSSLIYVICISELCVVSCPSDFLTIVVEYDPFIEEFRKVYGDSTKIELIPIVAKGVAAFYYNVTFL
jgi:hypothetical protein